jgi:GNAT superfamily N-acetyltransferase
MFPVFSAPSCPCRSRTPAVEHAPVWKEPRDSLHVSGFDLRFRIRDETGNMRAVPTKLHQAPTKLIIIAGVGPITIDPGVQNASVGRKLMEAVLARAAERKFSGVRLVQAAFHNRSLSLYSKLGFDVREPLSVMQGSPSGKRVEGCSVRPARPADLAECNRLCHAVHGHDRAGDLSDAIHEGTAVVVERGGRITGFASALAFFGHAVAETNPDLEALIGSVESFGGPGILVPTRNTELFRWCLSSGLRVVEPMTLMTVGLYNEPHGAYLPSILF